jgi:hypothetical protein
MSLWSLTEEEVQKLLALEKEKKQEKDAIMGTKVETMWEQDLEGLLKVLQEV